MVAPVRAQSDAQTKYVIVAGPGATDLSEAQDHRYQAKSMEIADGVTAAIQTPPWALDVRSRLPFGMSLLDSAAAQARRADEGQDPLGIQLARVWDDLPQATKMDGPAHRTVLLDALLATEIAKTHAFSACQASVAAVGILAGARPGLGMNMVAKQVVDAFADHWFPLAPPNLRIIASTCRSMSTLAERLLSQPDDVGATYQAAKSWLREHDFGFEFHPHFWDPPFYQEAGFPEGVTFVVNKETWGHEHTREISFSPFPHDGVLPTVRPVFLFRQPLATLRGWLGMYWKSGELGWRNLKMFEDCYRRSVDEFRRVSTQSPGSALAVISESLIPDASRAQAIQAICAHWDVPFDPVMIQPTRDLLDSIPTDTSGTRLYRRAREHNYVVHAEEQTVLPKPKMTPSSPEWVEMMGHFDNRTFSAAAERVAGPGSELERIYDELCTIARTQAQALGFPLPSGV